MGHRADELPVLQNGAAGHALDNAAGGFEQVRIRDPKEEIPVIRPGFGIDFQNFHRILPRLAGSDLCPDGSRARVNAFILRRRNRLTLPAARADAEHALRGIFQQWGKGNGRIRRPRS